MPRRSLKRQRKTSNRGRETALAFIGRRRREGRKPKPRCALQETREIERHYCVLTKRGRIWGEPELMDEDSFTRTKRELKNVIKREKLKIEFLTRRELDRRREDPINLARLFGTKIACLDRGDYREDEVYKVGFI